MNPFILSSKTGKFSCYFSTLAANSGMCLPASDIQSRDSLTDILSNRNEFALANSGGTAKVKGLEAFPFLCRALHVVKGKFSHQPQLLWALICSSQALASLFFSLVHEGKKALWGHTFPHYRRFYTNHLNSTLAPSYPVNVDLENKTPTGTELLVLVSFSSMFLLKR